MLGPRLVLSQSIGEIYNVAAIKKSAEKFLLKSGKDPIYVAESVKNINWKEQVTFLKYLQKKKLLFQDLLVNASKLDDKNEIKFVKKIINHVKGNFNLIEQGIFFAKELPSNNPKSVINRFNFLKKHVSVVKKDYYFWHVINKINTSQDSQFAETLLNSKIKSYPTIADLIDSANSNELSYISNKMIKKMNKIDRFDGRTMTYIVESVKSAEVGNLRLKFIDKLLPIKQFSNDNIVKVTNSVNTREQAKVKLDFINYLMKKNKFETSFIAGVSEFANNPLQVVTLKALINKGEMSLNKLRKVSEALN